MAEIDTEQVNVTLDPEHAKKLTRIAERANASRDALASSLLSGALDNADPDPAMVTELLEGIPGAFERVQEAEAQFERGELIELHEFR